MLRFSYNTVSGWMNVQYIQVYKDTHLPSIQFIHSTYSTQWVVMCCGSAYIFMYFFYFSSINKKALICNAKILFLFISEFYYTPYGLTQKAMPENLSFREILMTKDRTYVFFFCRLVEGNPGIMSLSIYIHMCIPYMSS